MTGKIEAPFVFGVRVEGDTFTDRHEETERLKANFTYSPTEFTEFTEASGRGYSPTDFTDAHRFLGCVLPPNLCASVQSVGVFVGGYGILPYPRHPLPILPQNSQNPQKRLRGKYSPTDFTDAHRSLGCVFAS